jgi:hypothetical protein
MSEAHPTFTMTSIIQQNAPIEKIKSKVEALIKLNNQLPRKRPIMNSPIPPKESSNPASFGLKEMVDSVA